MSTIEGAVIAVSESQTLVTDIPASALEHAPHGPEVSVHCDGYETPGVYPLDHGQPACTLVAFTGASGNLELTIVDEDISIMLGIRIGAKVQVKW